MLYWIILFYASCTIAELYVFVRAVQCRLPALAIFSGGAAAIIVVFGTHAVLSQ